MHYAKPPNSTSGTDMPAQKKAMIVTPQPEATEAGDPEHDGMAMEVELSAR